MTKPEEEWTARDYKAYNSREQRLMVASVLRQCLSEQKIPLNGRQKRIIERVRNGTDYDTRSSDELLNKLV